MKNLGVGTEHFEYWYLCFEERLLLLGMSLLLVIALNLNISSEFLQFGTIQSQNMVHMMMNSIVTIYLIGPVQT